MVESGINPHSNNQIFESVKIIDPFPHMENLQKRTLETSGQKFIKKSVSESIIVE